MKEDKYLVASKKYDALYVWQVDREPFVHCDLKIRVERQDLIGPYLTPDAQNLLVLTERRGFLAYDLDHDPPRRRAVIPMLQGQSDEPFLRSVIAASLKYWRLCLMDRRDNISHGCPMGHKNSIPLYFFTSSGQDRFIMGCGRRSKKDEKCSLRLFDRER